MVPPLQRDPLLDDLLGRGALFDATISRRKMAVSKRHENVVELWRCNDITGIATGYALFDEDGLWREHTWGVQDDGTLVETTVMFEGYFGYELTPTESEQFANTVLPEHE